MRSSDEQKKKMAMMMVDDDKGRTRTISDIPEEVLMEVLVRLSVKDIITCCVSVKKSWHSLIKNPIFTTLHSNYHHKKKITNPHDRKYLLFCTDYTYDIRVDDIECEKHLTLKYPPDLPYSLYFQLVSNGLICLFNPLTISKVLCCLTTMLHLWNPVIQKYKTLPPSPHPPYSHTWTRWQAIAFGFVPEIHDYIVVHMAKYGSMHDEELHTHYVMTYVYSLNNDYWKKITHDRDDDDSSILPNVVNMCSRYNSVFANGVAFWVGGNLGGEQFLVCFDIKTEIVRQILLPEWLGRYTQFIHAFDQSIACFVEDDKDRLDNNELGMWVLKGDPMNEYSWEKKMKVTLDDNVEVHVMGLRNNGDPILCHDYDLISYNLDNHKSYDFVEAWDSWSPLFDEWDAHLGGTPFTITPFEESLGLLDVDCMQY